MLSMRLVDAVQRLAEVHGAGFMFSAVAISGHIGPRCVGGDGFDKGA